jgi:hypothetical protein
MKIATRLVVLAVAVDDPMSVGIRQTYNRLPVSVRG